MKKHWLHLTKFSSFHSSGNNPLGLPEEIYKALARYFKLSEFVFKPIGDYESDLRDENEGNGTPRVCVSDTVVKCVNAIANQSGGNGMGVYCTEKMTAKRSVRIPDSRFTGEHWITEPVKMSLIGVLSPSFFLRLNNNGRNIDVGSWEKECLKIQEWHLRSSESLVKDFGLDFLQREINDDEYEKFKKNPFYVFCRTKSKRSYIYLGDWKTKGSLKKLNKGIK